MGVENNSYYGDEINIGEAIKGGAVIEDVLYTKELQERKLFLAYEVNSVGVAEMVKHILQYNKDDEGVPSQNRKPIFVYVMSPGGSIPDGLALIDAIMQSKTPVYTVCIGYAYSMAFLIMLAGHKRFSTANATFLMHDGQDMVWNSSAKVQDQVKFNAKLEERNKRFVLAHSSITEEKYESKYRVEWYMFADEAKENGFIDYIIGEDSVIDDIL